ncbi:MAG: flagellar biosynthesis regulator FlaF [Alphaproteobacteria bacterium]|nr:flagellar biosynthesis regulator FlaF [Alphaproteobacteria bacterium]MCZ6606362.1 flagellar biosynthesis regulator FlaF [Alphaproteobacteria bacterium]
MSTRKVATYEQVILSALSQREIDGMAFAKAVFRLEEASKAVEDYDAYSSALKFHQMLWTFIQADVAADGNGLPDDLKTNILSLSIFVDSQTIMALAEPSAEHLHSLIAIDKSIASGLLTTKPMDDSPQRMLARAS